MKIILRHNSTAGMFYIGQTKDNRFHPIYNNESLGSYTTLEQAIDDLTQNATFSVLHYETGELLDTSTLGLSEDPSDWETTS